MDKVMEVNWTLTYKSEMAPDLPLRLGWRPRSSEMQIAGTSHHRGRQGFVPSSFCD